MDWRLVLAILCLIGASARVDALSNQTTTNTTSTQSTIINSSTTNTTLAPRTTTNSSTTNTTSAQSTTTNSFTTNTTLTPRATTNISTTSANSPPRPSPTSSLTSTPVVAAVFNLVFSISETFDPALADTSSPQFAAKATSIRNQLEPVYRAAYTNFLQMIIVGFRNGSIVTNSRLEFSDKGTIPNNSKVQNTLVNVTTNNSSLNIDPYSVNVTQAPVTNTSSPNTTSATSTTTKSPTTNTTSTSSTTTTNIPPAPQNATAIFSLIFSINETFDPELANTSSPQFVAKATYIRNQVEPLYKKVFKNFILMQILKFTSGSTVTLSNLYMDSSGPNVTLSQVRDTFLNGLNSLNFSVDPKSVNVNVILGNSMPPVIGSLPSMIWMSLLSLLLSVALHF